MHPSHKHCAGFTIIELMVAIAVVSILLGIGVPAMNDLIRTNRIATQTNTVVGALNYARGETATRGIPITMCAANATRTGCNGSNDWSNGWVIFTDRTGAGTLGTGEELLQTSNGLTGGFNLGVTGIYLRFGVGAAPSTDLIFTVTPTDSGVCATTGRRVVTVANTGRVTTSKSTC